MPRMVRKGIERIAPHVKVWLEIEGEYVFGHGISEILKAVEREGSIKQAAASLGKSYRYVWKRIKDAEVALGAELVETRVGGQGASRSQLAPLARELVDAFDQLRAKMKTVVAEEFGRHLRRLRRDAGPKGQF